MTPKFDMIVCNYRQFYNISFSYFILHNNVYICNGNGQFRSVKLNDIWNSTCNIEYSLHFELKDSIEFIKNNSEWVIENFVQLLSFDYSVNECYIKFFIEIISLMLYFELLNYHNIDIIIGTISKYKRINILLDSTKFALSELLLKIYKFKLKFIMKRILKFSIITVGHISTDQKVRHQKLKIGDMNFDHNIELYKEYRSSLFNQMKLCTNYYNNIYKTSTFNSLYKQLYTKSNETLMHYISIEFTEENKIFYECIDNLLSCIQLDKMNKNLVQNIYNLFYIRNNPFNEVVESLNALIIVDSKFEKDLYIIISSYLEIETMKNVKFDTFDLSKFTILIKNIQHSNIFYVQSIVLAKIGLIKTLVDIFSLSFDIYQEEFQQTKLSIQQRVCITICRFIYLYVSTNENNKSEMFEYISIFIDKFTFLSDAIGLKYGSLPIHVITEIFRNSLQLICHINQNMIEKFIYELSRNYNKNSIRHFGIPDHYNWNPISSLNYINFFIKTLQTKDGSLIEVYSDLVFKMIVKSTNIVNLISKRSNKNALLTSNDLYDDIIYYIHLSLKIIFRNRESFYMMLEIMSDDYSITQVIYRNLHDYTEHYIDNIDISNINIGLYSLKYYKLITEFILLIIKSNNKVVTNDVQKKLVVRNIIQLNTLSKILSTNYIILLANEVNEFNKTDEIQIITLKPDMKRSIFDLLTSLYKFETEETFFQVYDSCFLIDLRVAAFLSKRCSKIWKILSLVTTLSHKL
ncbi:hypothetical protein A3Q56_05230 [Intoshia linei]|uniref:Uncharacterized protein n=1 Tax=Intoshia linei TaxID=1819745 RepID=A0A177AYG6_9BILA|nr:hypothetical protein A3Q56_05230 [Intoshia linei]